MYITTDSVVVIIFKKITQLGSNWNNGGKASAFYWNLNNSVGNRNRNIGSRLMYLIHIVNQKTAALNVPHLLVEERTKINCVGSPLDEDSVLFT